MSFVPKVIALLMLVPAIFFFTDCGSNNNHTTSSSGNGSGSSSGSSPSTTGPGFGVGIGSSGQTSPAKFLYASPLPGGGPFAMMINANGTLTGEQAGSANNIDPMTMAIDPSGTFVFQTVIGVNSTSTQSGVFVYAINRTSGSLGTAVASTTIGPNLVSDVVDNQGKFLYVSTDKGVYAFSIQSGTGALTAVPGSPFTTPATSNVGYFQPANLLAIDKTNKFLYASTSGGIEAFSINQTTGQLTPVAGSPFGTDITGPWTLAITPNNSFLYVLQAKSRANIYGFSVDQTSGALTPLAGSPFNAGSCGTVVPGGTVSVPGPDNITIASAGKFMYDNCGVYSINESSGALTVVSSQGPGDWPVIDPTGDFLWAITGDQTSCFHCDEGVTTYSVDANTGALTPVPKSFFFVTNSEVGAINSLAITK